MTRFFFEMGSALGFDLSGLELCIEGLGHGRQRKPECKSTMFENGPIPTKIVGHGIPGSRPTLRVQPENLAAAPAA